MTTGYSGTPLAAKLGIGAGSRFLLDGAPELPELALPDGATTPGRGPYDVVVCFCPDAATMRRRFPALQRRTTPVGRLWVAWPKKSSGVRTDLTENEVRSYGLARGLVDVKVCAIDAIWSGLAFVVPVADRRAGAVRR